MVCLNNLSILIVTTNHPERLDKALIRAGRIDMKVNFSKCSVQVCLQILELYFKTRRSTNQITKLPSKKWSPAEVFELCYNINDLNQVLDMLNNNNNIHV